MKHARSDYDQIQDSSGKIPEDEPVFILRAKDALAASTVMHWAQLARANGVHPDLVYAAQKQAIAMAEYKPKEAKLPDAPAEVLR